jgi:hypothetical protein
MHHHHPGQRAGRAGRLDQVGVDVAVALGRGGGDGFGVDRRVVRSDLLGERLVGHQAVDHRGDGQAADGEFGGLVEKLPLADLAVGVTIIEIEQFLIEIAGFLPFHDFSPLMTVSACRLPPGASRPIDAAMPDIVLD